MYKKLFKWLIVATFIIFLILNLQFVIDIIVSTNLDVSQRSFFGLCALFFIEISIILIFYDFLILEIYVFISSNIDTLGRLLIKKKRVGLAQFMIRVDYNISRIVRLLRLGWVRYGSSNISPVWIGISKSTLVQKTIYIVRLMISFPAISSIVLTLFTLNIIDMDWLYSQREYLLEFLKKAVTIKINFGDVFSKLPAVVALLTILPAFFFFYFYSQKREVRKIIDKKNKESFEIVVTKHEELSKFISKSIYPLSENLDYVINCQSLMIELILNKKVKNLYKLEGTRSCSIGSVRTYLFKEVPEMEKIAELITELTNEELDYFTRLFSVKRYDMWHLYSKFYECKTSERLNRLFLTEQGVEEKISNISALPFDCSEEELARYRNEEKNILSYNIYDALEMLYTFKRYNESLKRYLNSSNVEKTLMKTLVKDK